jgi:hypothetical protein
VPEVRNSNELTLAELGPERSWTLESVLPGIWRQDRLAGDPILTRQLVDWRYRQRPHGRTFVALQDGNCIGLIDAFRRTYVVNDARRVVHECCDWWSDPAQRPAGLGLRLMRRLMREPTPILAIGDSPGTLELLPRLGWKTVGESVLWVLPLKARHVASALLRRRRRESVARLIPPFLPLGRVRATAPPLPSPQVHQWQPTDGPPGPDPTGVGLAAVADEADLVWLCSAPTAFAHIDCHFYCVDGERVGCVLTQLEMTSTGREGKILHIQVSRLTPKLLSWMIGDAANRLARQGAGIIRARSSAPVVHAALRRSGFLTARKDPVYWWGSDPPQPDSPLLVSYLRADDALPFETARG